MHKNNQHKASFEKLRKDAQAKLLQQSDSEELLPSNPLELIEELKLHQIELELQNEELLCSKSEIEELHKSFAELYELAPCGYLELSHAGTIKRANLRVVEILGVDREPLLHMSLGSFFADSSYAQYLEAKNRAVQTGERQSIELQLKPKHESTSKWVSTEMVSVIDEHGEALGWRITMTDITVRKEMQKKLEEKECYIKAAFDAQQDMSFITIGGVELEYCNRAVLEFFGYESIEKLKESVKCICDYFEKDEGFLQKSMDGQNWLDFVLANRDKNIYAKLSRQGKEHIFSVYAERLEGDPKKRCIVSLNDVSYEVLFQKELQEEIAYKTEELEAMWELNKEHERNLLNQRRINSLHELMKNVSHHWRQPLTVLSLYISDIILLMEEKGIRHEEYDKKVETMEDSIRFMSKIITSFQNLTKDASDERFELKSTLLELTKLLKERLLAEGVEIELKGDDAWLAINRAKLLDVIQSLIENGRESIASAKTKNRSLEGKIEIEIRGLTHIIQIHIRDNGIGVSENIMDAVFDPYFTTKFKSEGVGLSLYFAKLIIEGEFRGEIYLNRAYKSGAEFIIELPLFLSTPDKGKDA